MSPIDVLEQLGGRKEPNKKLWTKTSIAGVTMLLMLMIGLGLSLWQANTNQEIKKSKASERDGRFKNFPTRVPTPTPLCTTCIPTPTPRPPTPTPLCTTCIPTPTPRPPTVTPTPSRR